jgi:hypothetical protein
MKHGSAAGLLVTMVVHDPAVLTSTDDQRPAGRRRSVSVAEASPSVETVMSKAKRAALSLWMLLHAQVSQQCCAVCGTVVESRLLLLSAATVLVDAQIRTEHLVRLIANRTASIEAARRPREATIQHPCLSLLLALVELHDFLQCTAH